MVIVLRYVGGFKAWWQGLNLSGRVTQRVIKLARAIVLRLERSRKLITTGWENGRFSQLRFL